MQSLNSDQLRKLLKKHTRKMNWISEQNDLIVAMLKQRGLQPVEFERLSDVFGAGGEIVFKKKPLTVDELKAGGWWMLGAARRDARAFLSLGLAVHNQGEWGLSPHWMGCCKGKLDQSVSRTESTDGKQIHRIGDEFYWGAP
jgi:hypothetical protein